MTTSTTETTQRRQGRRGNACHLKRKLESCSVDAEGDRVLDEKQIPRETAQKFIYLGLFCVIAVATILIMFPAAVVLGVQRLWDELRLGEVNPLR